MEDKYDWMEHRIDEQQSLIDNMAPERKRHHWMYDSFSSRYDRHFDKWDHMPECGKNQIEIIETAEQIRDHDKYDWMDNRIGEQEQLIDNMMAELNIEKGDALDFQIDSIQGNYLDWAYGQNSKRFSRHFDNLADMRLDLMGMHYGRNE